MSSSQTSLSPSDASHQSDSSDLPPPYVPSTNRNFVLISIDGLSRPAPCLILQNEARPHPPSYYSVDSPTLESRWSLDTNDPHPPPPARQAVINTQPLPSIPFYYDKEDLDGQTTQIRVDLPPTPSMRRPSVIANATREYNALAQYDFVGDSYRLFKICGRPIDLGSYIHFFILEDGWIKRGRGTVVRRWRTGNPSLIGFVVERDSRRMDTLLLIPVERPPEPLPIYSRIACMKIPCMF
jgi:hypothetical protein